MSKFSPTRSILCRTTRSYFVRLAISLTFFLLLVVSLNILADPFFHYHRPLNNRRYSLHKDYERYFNDGIARHFQYDALLTGTSMTENFKSSQLDELFSVKSIKAPFSGGSYAEINRLVKQAIRSQPDLKIIFRGLDLNRLITNAPGSVSSTGDIPTYLYNDNPFDDVNYLLNWSVLKRSVKILSTPGEGEAELSFDEYGDWMKYFEGDAFGKSALKKAYERPVETKVKVPLTPASTDIMLHNLEENVISVARENPGITFYYFFPPYSILFFDQIKQTGELDLYLELYRLAIKQMLTCPNVRLFSFFDDFNLTTNLDNYRDALHYSDRVNADMLNRMAAGEGELTAGNYEEHWKNCYRFYKNYNYDELLNTIATTQ